MFHFSCCCIGKRNGEYVSVVARVFESKRIRQKVQHQLKGFAAARAGFDDGKSLCRIHMNRNMLKQAISLEFPFFNSCFGFLSIKFVVH